MSRTAPAVALFCVVAWTTPALAQRGAELERARTMFEEGRAAYESGDYELALTRFRSAHEMTGSPDILYNIATCADRLRQDQVALEAYQGYLEGRPDSVDRAQVEARIAVITRQIESERAAQEAAAQEALERDAQARRLEEERRTLREQLAARPTAVRPDPGPAPWVILGAGLGVAVIGAGLAIAAEVDASCVTSPTGCVADPSMPRWSEVSGAYDRVPILQGVGYTMLGVGMAGALVGLVFGLVAGGGSGESVGAGIEPGGPGLRGRF